MVKYDINDYEKVEGTKERNCFGCAFISNHKHCVVNSYKQPEFTCGEHIWVKKEKKEVNEKYDINDYEKVETKMLGCGGCVFNLESCEINRTGQGEFCCTSIASGTYRSYIWVKKEKEDKKAMNLYNVISDEGSSEMKVVATTPSKAIDIANSKVISVLKEGFRFGRAELVMANIPMEREGQ